MTPYKWDVLIIGSGALSAICGTALGIWLALQPIRDLTKDMDALSAAIDQCVSELKGGQ